jgi:transcriptional regulator with XRE-family HTH domain
MDGASKQDSGCHFRLLRARGVTQQEIAQAWESTQSNVSRFEHAQDTSLSTLIRYAAALGGRLELRVVFSDQVVDLSQTTRRLPWSREAGHSRRRSKGHARETSLWRRFGSACRNHPAPSSAG